MGSDECHFNISLSMRVKVTLKTVSTDHNLSKEKEAEVARDSNPRRGSVNSSVVRAPDS